MVIDYKMKLELGKRVREIQRDWYGKRGISLHGCYVAAKVDENQYSSEVFDLWVKGHEAGRFLYPECTGCLLFLAGKGLSWTLCIPLSFLVCECFKFII